MYPRTIAISNRHLCQRDFPTQMEIVARAGVKAIILREKDLSESKYYELATHIKKVIEPYDTTLILHTYIDVARYIHHKKIHLPLELLRQNDVSDFDLVGVSTHSVEEAKEAENLGVDYVTASHIFPTDCKRGIPARGLEYLKAVVNEVNIPVYALGGITPERVEQIEKTGVKGYCMMSYFANIVE